MRLLVVLVCAAVMGLAAWFLFPTPEGPRHDRETPGGSQASPVETAAAHAREPRIAEQVESTPASGDLPARTSVAPTSERSTSGPGSWIRAVRFDGGEPIPAATLDFYPADFELHTADSRLLELQQTDPAAFFERIGGRRVTDRSGFAEIPLHRAIRLVTARAEGLYATAYPANDAERPFVMRLRRSATLRVRVVDADGEPVAGARIGIQRPDSESASSLITLPETDADGRATYPNCQQLAGDRVHDPVLLTAQVGGLVSRSHQIDIVAPPDEVCLRLPPAGSILVHCVDEHGAPLHPALHFDPRVALRLLRSPGASDPSPGHMHEARALIDDEGSALFSHVAPGQRFAIEFPTLESAEFDGPRHPGSRVAVTLRRLPGSVLLTGRLLLDNRSPAAHQGLQISARAPLSARTGRHRTDATGRFLLWLSPDFAGQVVSLRMTPAPGPPDPRRLWGLAPAPFEVRAGTNDLGDLVVPEPHPIVAGRITPMDDVTFRRTWVHLVPGRPREKGLEHLHAGYDARTWLAPDGRFAIYGSARAGEAVRVQVEVQDTPSIEPVICKAGTTDLEVRLDTGGAVEATFLVDASLPYRRLTYTLLPRDPGVGDPAPRSAPAADPDASRRIESIDEGRVRLRWRRLSAGTYDLAVACRGSNARIATVDAIVVADGPSPDPRLADIDLRGLARAFRIEARDANGMPVRSTDALVLVDAESGIQGFHLGAGAVELVSPAPLDLFVDVPGHRIERRDSVFTDQTVQLLPAPTCSIRVEFPRPLPAGARVSLVLQALEDDDRWVTHDAARGRTRVRSHWSTRVQVEPGTPRSIPVRRRGVYRPFCNVFANGRQAALILEPAEITLDPSTPPTELVLRARLEVVDRVLDRLRPR